MAKQLTPKQVQVRDRLLAGATVAEAAEQMKVTASAVHGHVRRIKEAGYSVEPASKPKGKPRKRTAKPTPLAGLAVVEPQVVSSNGNGYSEHGVDVEGTIRAALAEIDARQDAIEGETDALNTQVDNLNDEQRQLEAQKERYTAALEVVV